MRGLATLALTLMLLAPTASAAGLLTRITSEAVDVTVSVVQPAASLARPAAATLVQPVAVGSSLSLPVDRPEAPEVSPVEEDAVIELPEEVPVGPDTVALHVRDSKPEFAAIGKKADRLDAASAIGPRAPVALPQARLPLAPPASALPIAPGARASAPDAPIATPASPQPHREAPTKETPEVPDSHDGAWRAAFAVASLAIAILAPFLLYHRLRGARSLESDARARIVELLKATPGMSPAQVARALEVDPTTALYHLRFLVREGLVLAEGPRRGARYFAAGTTPVDERARIVAVQGAEDVLDAIKGSPGTPKTELAGKLAIARATLAWHLGRLERAGLVRYERAGRNVLVYPKESLSAQPSA